jgi:hypothetical protein
VLKVNFQKIGRAAEKIEHGEFAINDASTKHDIDLETDWDVCFFPGQRVEMSMVFDQQQNTGSQSPKCQERCDPSSGLDVEWYISYFLTCIEYERITRFFVVRGAV